MVNSPLGAQRNRLAVAPDLCHRARRGCRPRVSRRDLGDRQVQRLEPARIEIHLQLAHLAAVHLDGGDAVDLPEQRLEVVFDHAARHVGGELDEPTA